MRESARGFMVAVALAVIAGASSTLAEHGHDLDRQSRASLARSIEAKAREMSDLVSNVLI